MTQNPSPKKNERLQNMLSTPSFSPQHWQFYLYTQSFSPFLQLGNKTQAQRIFHAYVVNGAFWLQSIRNLTQRCTNCFSMQHFSLSKSDVFASWARIPSLSCQPSSCLWFKSRVLCHSTLPPLCSQQQAKAISLGPKIYSSLCIWGLYLGWGEECLHSFSFEDKHRDKQSHHRVTQG